MDVRFWLLMSIPVMPIDPQHRYSNEAEMLTYYIYDDFKLKKIVLSVYIRIFYATVESRYSANRYTAISVITRSAPEPRFFQGEIWLMKCVFFIFDHASLVKTSPIHVHVTLCWPGMYACSHHCTPPHPSCPHCWQVRPRTTRQITLLTNTVQNEIISENSVNALYMLYRGIWCSSYRGINLKRWINDSEFWWYCKAYTAVYGDPVTPV